MRIGLLWTAMIPDASNAIADRYAFLARPGSGKGIDRMWVRPRWSSATPRMMKASWNMFVVKVCTVRMIFLMSEISYRLSMALIPFGIVSVCMIGMFKVPIFISSIIDFLGIRSSQDLKLMCRVWVVP